MAEYDPLLTMAALNLAVVSLHRITSAKDMVIQRGRLREDERSAVKGIRYEHKRRSIREIISGNVLKSFSLNPLEWLGNLAQSCMSDYFDSLKEEEESIRRNQDENLRLKREELDEYAELQRKLLGASWTLLRQYELSDSYRLTQNGLDKFYAATQQDNPSKRLRMLKYLDGDFAMYSPYWFYRCRAAQEAGDQTEAGKSLEILRCLAEVRENVELEDWANNIYLGMMYFTLGDKEKAVESVMCNVDFGFETEASEKLLAKFEGETPPKKFAAAPAKSPEAPKPEPVRTVREEPEPKPKKQPLKERAESGDAEAQYQLGLSYEKHKDTTALAAVVICAWLCAGWLVLHYLVPSSFIWCSLWIVFVCWIAFGLGVNIIDNMPEEYYEPRAVNWFTKAVENGHVEAMYRLAEIYHNNHNRDEAERWYKNANAEAHKMFYDIQPREPVPQPDLVSEPAPSTSPEDIRKSAEGGDLEAQYTLGMMYFNGQDVFMNYKEAVKWLEMAGNAGHSWAQLQLGRMYYSCIGVKKDEGHGVNLMKKAAELGNAEAQYTLAKIYRQGTRKNFQQSLALCSAAAVQNHHEAQAMLAEMYRDSGDKRQYHYWRKKALEPDGTNKRQNT